LLKGDVDVARNRFDEADSSYRRGLQLGRELNGHQLINRALRRLANSQQRNGRPETAVDMLTEAIDLARQTGDGFGIADSAVELASALMAAKRLSKAQAAAQEGFVAASRISNPTYLYKLGLLQARLWKQAKKKQRADEMLMALDAQVPPHHPLRAAIDEALTEVDPEYSVHERDFGTLVDTIMAGVI
ncbi:MAG: tetratricopeptide repeat protein, partial [Myxococcota bacterium]